MGAKSITPDTAREALDAAEAEKTEAEQLGQALADKVRAGDDSVQPKDLSAARELAEFAELRVTAARRKLDAANEADRHARAEHAVAEACSSFPWRVEKVFGDIPAVREVFTFDEQQLAGLPVEGRHRAINLGRRARTESEVAA